MRRFPPFVLVFVLAVLVVSSLASAGAASQRLPAGGRASSRSTLPAPTALGTTPIEHVVIIYQENHSFDNVLGKFCAQVAAGTITGHDPCDGATTGRLHTGALIQLRRATDLVHGVDHSVAGHLKAINGGAMDGFSRLLGCRIRNDYACYSQYDPSQIPNLTTLVRQYAMSDRTFEFAPTPSWGSHIVLGAATLNGFVGDTPLQSTFTSETGPYWGCDSLKDAQWWNGTGYETVPSCIPDLQGNGPYRPSPVPYVPTIFDRVEGAGLTWKIYGGQRSRDEVNRGSGWGWTICPTFFECLGSGQRNNLVNASKVIPAAQNGNLPNLTIVTPSAVNSQHNNYSMAQGDNWIGNVVSAIQSGPNWPTTAIFIAYDDCGCFYDHVPPPTAANGIRVPVVIVSPFAKPGFTDHTTATLVSLLAYIENVFGLAPLTANDANAYDYSGAFDYTQAPLAPLASARMVRTAIPRWERRQIASLPPEEDPSSDEGLPYPFGQAEQEEG